MSKKAPTVATVMWLLLYVAEGRDPVLHRVGGGKQSWAPNVNFSEWAIREQFYVGDWLYFGFDKHVYNVLEVNQTSYETCNEDGFLTNITRGGRDVFNLTEARPYYFVCGRGFCFQGMKVAVLVNDENLADPISPSPSTYSVPTKNFSPSSKPITHFFLLLGLAYNFMF